MNKLCKILSIAVLMIAILSISITAQAYTNDDVISYITRAHTVNGRTIKLSGTQRESLKKYLTENPVTDAEANEIITKLNTAKSKIQNTGATNLSQLSDSVKAEVVSLVKEAGAIAGLDVEVNTINETVTIKDSKGNTIIRATSYSQFNENVKSASKNDNGDKNNSSSSTTSNSGKKLVYTGNNYSVAIKTIVAIVAIAIVGGIIRRYAR